MPNDIQENKPCHICNESALISNNFDDDADTVECDRCGRYRITEKAREALAESLVYGFLRKAKLATAVRQATERGAHVEITVEQLPKLADSAVLSPDPMSAADDILLHLERFTWWFGMYVRFSIATAYPLFALTTPASLKTVVEYMTANGYASLRHPPDSGLSILPGGFARIRELKAANKGSTRAFVAMSFHPDHRRTYDNGIKQAVISTGFEPIRVDDVAHNERIDERIIAEIRRSAFVVADFSDPRTGVFFEAGFGLGLGIPVIWTCSSANFDALPKHFDTRQFNYIKWETVDDLQERLRTRILATVPGAREVKV